MWRVSSPARARPSEFGFDRNDLHSLVIGDPDDLLLTVDRQRGVLFRTEARFQGAVYRIVEMTEVDFDEDLPPETFEIRPLPGNDWEGPPPRRRSSAP